MSNSEKIRKALSSLNNPAATNKQISNQCQKLYSWKPTPQALHAALGSENLRKLRKFDAVQMLEVKNCNRKYFDNDFEALEQCLLAVKAYSNNQ